MLNTFNICCCYPPTTFMHVSWFLENHKFWEFSHWLQKRRSFSCLLTILSRQRDGKLLIHILSKFFNTWVVRRDTSYEEDMGQDASKKCHWNDGHAKYKTLIDRLRSTISSGKLSSRYQCCFTLVRMRESWGQLSLSSAKSSMNLHAAQSQTEIEFPSHSLPYSLALRS